jgi:transposase
MAFRRLSVRKIHLVLRLFFAAGMSIRAISRSIKASPSTVGDYIRRAQVAGLGWPLPEGMDERALEARLFPPPQPSETPRPLPEWAYVHRERRRKGVTLALLWQEYKAEHPDGVQYSWFCERYHAWAQHVDVVMRQTHRAGEKLFVDYAGDTVPVVDRATGEIHEAQVFVAVLGASNYTFAEATWTQQLAHWCASHVRALRFFGGCSELVVPDNLRSAVTSPHRYEPDLNPSYQDLAEHYGFAIVPARVGRARDKAKVEAGVLLVERWILAALRNRTFFSLAELNTAIAELLGRLNERPFKKLPGSRRTLFESLEQPLLNPLPVEPYVFAQWKKVRVHIDYHVEFERHYYSVPYTLARKQLQLRYTASTVECLYLGERVASHVRAHLPGRHTTVPEHMPEKHRHMSQWSPERFARWAEKIGPATAALITRVLGARRHPEQSYRTCLGILRLAKSYSDTRLDAACQRALILGSQSVRSVESILKHRLDEQPLTESQQSLLPDEHENLRGSTYFH